MSCHNTNNDCGCSKPCNTVHCECPVRIDSDCVTVKNSNFTCSNIEDEQTLTEVLNQIDEYICDKFDLTVSFFTLLNVGAGSQIYKGVDGTGRKLIRTLVDSNLINLTQGTDEITISVDETALNTFIEANQKLTTLASVGSGQTLIKGSTITGDTTRYDIKELISSDESVQISPTTDEVDITTCLVSPNDSVRVELVNSCWEISLPSDENIKQFYVNQDYTGTSNGSILKPFPSLVDALMEMIGTSTDIATPQYPYAQIILQTDVTVTQAELTANSILQNKLSVNTMTLKSDSTQKRTITFEGTTNYPIDTELLVSEVGFDGSSNLLAPVLISLESVEIVCTEAKGIVKHRSYSGGSVNTYDSLFIAKNTGIVSGYKPSGSYVNALKSDTTNIQHFGNDVLVQSTITNDTPHLYFYGYGAGGEGTAVLENVTLKGTNQNLLRLYQTSVIVSGTFETTYDIYYLNTEDETVTDGTYLPKSDISYFDLEDAFLVINYFNESAPYPINVDDVVSGRPNFVGGCNSIFKLRGVALSKYKDLVIRQGFISGTLANYLIDTDKDFSTNIANSDFSNFYSHQEALLLSESPQPVSTKVITFNNSSLNNVSLKDVSNNITLSGDFATVNSLPFSTTLPAYESNSLAKAAGLIEGNFYINNNATFMTDNAGGAPGFLTIVF